MLINMVLPGAAGSAEEPFAFEYSGNYTDNRVDGIGTVRLNTSGTLTVLSGTATVEAYILAGGGGCLFWDANTDVYSGGGGGGNKTIEVTLEPGTYEIVIGKGGSKVTTTNGNGPVYAASGGNTVAFGETCIGGTGGGVQGYLPRAGTAGSPNATDGTTAGVGGSPNGGGKYENGGDGYVELTFS